MTNHISLTADLLVLKIKRILMISFGKSEKEASMKQFYQALCYAIRDEIMINNIATKKTFEKERAKKVYFLSMEYLPGKMLENYITKLKITDLIQAVLKKTDREYGDLLENDPDPGLGNGGLGRLVSCFLDSLATQNYPAMGYGLRYQYGIFQQELWNGVQVEKPDCWLLQTYPLEFRDDENAKTVKYRGKILNATNIHRDEIYQIEDHEEVRAIPFDIPIIGYSELPEFFTLNLRLWSTKESPRNFELQRYNAGQLGQANENTSITDVLYPNDDNEMGKRIRLKQEFLLVSASIQDILNRHLNIFEDMNLLSDKVQIQINDTHPALVIAELTRLLITHHDIPWKRAIEITQHTCNFTNHTTLREALEDWNENRTQELLPRQHRIIQRLNQDFCEKIRNKFPNDEARVKRMSIIENGQIKMAHLAIYGSKKINGVAKLHTEILKNTLFKDFYEMYPEKFVAITNGITIRRWLMSSNPLLCNFITKRIGSEWMTNFDKIQKLHEFAEDKKSQEEFIGIKMQNKKRLIEFLSKENPIRDFKGKIISHSPVLNESALFDVQIKRFHEYKRQLLNALHLLMLFNDLKEDPNCRKIKRFVIIGGKAAPGYVVAKQIILLLCSIARKINNDPKVSEKLKVAFVEDYNVTKAALIIPAADISEQISTAGFEASGTGNMKLTINGALTVGTEDGANIEMKEFITEKWWPFSFGSSAQEIKSAKQSNSYKPWDIYLQNPKIKKVIDALKDGSLVKTDTEHVAFTHLYEILLDGYNNIGSDSFFVLNDLNSYYEVQKKVENLYEDKYLFAKYVLHNIASMGSFSSDAVIDKYAKLIWDLKKCPMNKEIFLKIKKEYEI